MNCIRCGTKMHNTLGGNYDCPKCKFGINDLIYRQYKFQTTDLEYPEINGSDITPNTPNNVDDSDPQSIFGQSGWICPICGRGVSPWVSTCPCRNSHEITFNEIQ